MTMWDLLEKASRSGRPVQDTPDFSSRCQVCGRLFEAHATDELDRHTAIYERCK